MGRFIFILGGARSGKSQHAVNLAKSLSKKVVYVATCINPDKEMKERLKLHKKSRPHFWKTITCLRDIDIALVSLNKLCKAVVIDCLGLLVANLMKEGLKDEEIKGFLEKIARIIVKSKYITILVSNEVGSGIVPDNYLARRFRDLLGLTNQLMARYADEVIFMQAGIPIEIKNLRRKILIRR